MCNSLMKGLLIAFNALFFLIGVGLTAGAAYINWANDDIKSYLEVVSFGDDINDIDTNSSAIQIAIYVTLGLGVLIAFISFMGCCGSICKSKCMLNVYCTLCGVLLLGEVTVAVLAVVFKDKIESVIEDELTNQATGAVTAYPNNTLTNAWHIIQKEVISQWVVLWAEGDQYTQLVMVLYCKLATIHKQLPTFPYKLKCCGGSGPGDFAENEEFDDNMPVPVSCCVLDEDNEPLNETLCFYEALALRNSSAMTTDSPLDVTTEYIHDTGCHDALLEWFNDKLLYFIIGGFVIALVQVLGIVFACCVKKEIGKE